MSKLVYIASPYSSGDDMVQHHRYKMVRDFTAKVMMAGEVVPFSPIVHCHDMALHWDMPKTYDFWLHVNEVMLRHCDELWVYKLRGWDSSCGVAAEVEYAGKIHIPVIYKEDESC